MTTGATKAAKTAGATKAIETTMANGASGRLFAKKC